MKTYLLVDIGSTTTKAIICTVEGETELATSFVAMADAPTTVEAPYEDVAIGLNNALERLREQLDRGRASGDMPGLLRRFDLDLVDGFLLTSSAGGGLQMLVIGLIKSMTGESAERAALGGGGVILDVMAQDDQKQPFERIERIRSLRPDMILLAGGVEGGAILDVAVLAEMLFQAKPTNRLDNSFKLPLIYAGNSELHPFLMEKATDFALILVENLRPTLDQEHLAPTRRAIQEQFMEHVMAHAPGYASLKETASAPILPTPLAVSRSLQMLAENQGTNLLAVDIGGATTDIFTLVDNELNRSVSANLGMSYSVMNVLKEAGVAALLRWLPESISERDVRDWLHNKMLRPTTLPHTALALQVEQALAREALRLALVQHQQLTVELKGNKPEGDWRRSTESFFGSRQKFQIADIGLIVGSGGVISHAPDYLQAAAILVDAFIPTGWTDLLLDQHFTMPHIGALTQIDPAAALRLLLDHSLMRLGACLAPRGLRLGSGVATKVVVEPARGASREVSVYSNALTLVPLEKEMSVQVSLRGTWNLDYGSGFWQGLTKECPASEVGLIFDLRGRPLPWNKTLRACREQSTSWRKQLDLYHGEG